MLTKAQKAVFWIGILCLGLQLCWVPWTNSGGYPAGYGFLFSPPANVKNVDTVRLFLSLILIAGVFATAMYFAGRFNVTAAIPDVWRAARKYRIPFGLGICGIVLLLIDRLLFEDLKSLLISFFLWAVALGIVSTIWPRIASRGLFVWIFVAAVLLDLSADLFAQILVNRHAPLGDLVFQSANLPAHLRGDPGFDFESLSNDQLFEIIELANRRKYSNQFIDEKRNLTGTTDMDRQVRWVLRCVPVVSIVTKTAETIRYNNAIRRLRNDSLEPDDILFIVECERRHK